MSDDSQSLVGHAREPVESQRHRADIVDEDVEPAVVLSAGDERLRTVWRGESTGIASTGTPSATRAEIASDIPRAGNHAHAFSNQRLRDGEADALARAGDHGHLILQSEDPRLSPMLAVSVATIVARFRRRWGSRSFAT